MLNPNYVRLCGMIVGDKARLVPTATGGSILAFDLRTAERWRGRNGQPDSEHLEYHRVILRNAGNYQMASRCKDMILPGNRILITGKLRYKLFKDKNGGSFKVTEIDADGVELLHNAQVPPDPAAEL